MIGEAKSCKGGMSLAHYVIKDYKGYELLKNGVTGNSPTEILQEMKIIQDLNQRAVKKTLSLVLSPHIEEGKNLSDDQLRRLTRDFLKDLNIDPDQHQYFAFVHTEKSHKHIHIIANRVSYDGALFPDSFIGKKAQWAASRVAIKHGLISAKERQIENIKKLDEEKHLDKAIRKNIKRKHDWVMKQKPKSMQDYFSIMRKLGVEVTPTINLSGKVQGMRMKDLESGKDYKASEVHRSLSLIQILKTGIPYDRPLENDDPINTEHQADFDYESSGLIEPESKGVSVLEVFISSQNIALSGNSNEDKLDKKCKRKKYKTRFKR